MAEPTKPPPKRADDFDTRLAERMAAQIDGTLPDGVSFLDGLADDDLAVFAEAAAIQRELEEEDRAAGVIPLHPRPTPTPEPVSTPARRRAPMWRDLRVLAAAAVIAFVAVGTWMWTGGGRGPGEPFQVVALLDRRDLPADYETARPPMTGTRSDDDRRTEPQRAAQVGVYVVDLELAIRGGQAEARARLATAAANAVGARSGVAASAFVALGASTEADTAALLAELRSAADVAVEVLDADRVALGAWAEAARFAAGDRDAAFFRDPATAAALDRAESRLAGEAAASAALGRIRQALGTDSPDWGSLAPAVSALLEAIA